MGVESQPRPIAITPVGSSVLGLIREPSVCYWWI